MLDWIVRQDITPASMSALQYRHEAPPRHGAMCRGPSSPNPVGGSYPHPSLASTFPAQSCPSILSAVFLLRALALNVILGEN